MGLSKLPLTLATSGDCAERWRDHSLPGCTCRMSSCYSVRSCLKNKEGWGLGPSPQVQLSVTRGNKTQNQNQNQNQADRYCPQLHVADIRLGLALFWVCFLSSLCTDLEDNLMDRCFYIWAQNRVETKHVSAINNKSKPLPCPLLPNISGPNPSRMPDSQEFPDLAD